MSNLEKKSNFFGINDFSQLSIFDYRLLTSLPALLIFSGTYQNISKQINQDWYQMTILASFMMICVILLVKCQLSRIPIMYAIEGFLMCFYTIVPLVAVLMCGLNVIMIFIDLGHYLTSGLRKSETYQSMHNGSYSQFVPIEFQIRGSSQFQESSFQPQDVSSQNQTSPRFQNLVYPSETKTSEETSTNPQKIKKRLFR